jgi:hypothetical protein
MYAAYRISRQIIETNANADELEESTARLTHTPDATFVASGVYEHGDFSAES